MSLIFPKWMNALPTLAAVGAVTGLIGVSVGGWYWLTPDFYETGYQPKQPGAIGFPHHLHAGKLGMDCRYCHTKVEKSYEANIPNVATCYGCHAEQRLGNWEAQTKNVDFVRKAYGEDESIQWRRIHKLPDYVHNFPHHIHVKAGVSCYSCHGQITAMPVVHQVHGMGMGWCLDCHRNPGPNLVPPDKVTQLVWVEEHLKERAQTGDGMNDEARRLLNSLTLQPPENCGACHY